MYSEKLEKCHIKASATSVDTKNNTVSLSNGETVEYTDLVIACGSSSPFPGKLGKDNFSPSNKEILEMYADFRKEVCGLINFYVFIQKTNSFKSIDLWPVPVFLKFSFASTLLYCYCLKNACYFFG